MPASKTAPHKVTATDGTEITIGVPIGEIRAPTERAEGWWVDMQDERGWKYPTKTFYTTDKELADEVAHCLIHYTGGCERVEPSRNSRGKGGKFEVWSKGYYEYIGS